jgi:hypothetical protein
MDIKVKTKDITKLFSQLGKMPKGVHSDAFTFLRQATPIRSGNARRKTKKESRLRIGSRYGYAGKLDDGFSRQAPDGFTEPTIDKMEQLVDREIRKID